MSTPNITREIFDGNLTRDIPQGSTNRRVVILGTAADGPMHTPVRVATPGEAEDIFGSISDGNLVRGIKECLDAQAGFSKSPNVSGMRIGSLNELKATRSSKEIADDAAISLITIEAVDAGTVYDGINIKFDTSLGKVSIYNPKTKLYSTYTYSWNGNNSDADVKSLEDLVNLINADANLKDVMYAAVYEHKTATEFKMDAVSASGSIFTTGAGGSTTIDISAANISDIYAS